MKSIALAFIALLAGVCAVPSEVHVVEGKNGRNIEDLILSIIEFVKELIDERGLDPYILASADAEYTFPVPGIFKVTAEIEAFVFSGIGNIVVNEVAFEDGELLVDLTWPGIEAVVGDAAAEAQILKRKIEAGLSGRLAIKDLRLAARGTLSFSGYLINDISLSSSLGGIESELNINILGRDLSDRVNEFLSVTLPEALEEYNEQLNRLVARLILRLVDRFFPGVL